MAYYGKTNFGQIKYIDMELNNVILGFLESALELKEIDILELPNVLTEEININGSYTCDTYEAKKQVELWKKQDEQTISAICWYYQNELKTDVAIEYFLSIETFQVYIIIAVLEQFIWQSEATEEYGIDSVLKGQDVSVFVHKLIDELQYFGNKFEDLFW